MSDNVELVKRSFEAVSAWDLDALLELYDPDVQLMPLTGMHVETGGYRGHDGVREYTREAQSLWEVLEPRGKEFTDLGDRVLVNGTCRVRGRASGAEDLPACAWVIEIRDGRITSWVTYRSYEEAARAAETAARPKVS
jgi:ketosteroid isomerase-like protein